MNYRQKCAAVTSLFLYRGPTKPLLSDRAYGRGGIFSAKPQFSNHLERRTSNSSKDKLNANMAGRREVFERTRFRDRNRSSASQEQNVGDSMHRINNSENIPTEARTEPSTIAARSFKDEEIGNPSMHFSSARMQGNATNPTIDYRDLAHQPFRNHDVSGQHSQGHQVQGPPARDQNQNLQARSVSQELPGLIPPREIDILPPDGDVDAAANYRRMAVCQETDDALGQRTKMRVYMKRF